MQPPRNTSDIACLRPSWASLVTSWTPSTPLSRILSRNSFHELYDSVSTTASPRMCRQPSASQPIAVTMAVEETCPSLLHFTYVASSQT